MRSGEVVVTSELDKETEGVQRSRKLVERIYHYLNWCEHSNDRQQFKDRVADVENFYRGKQWDGIKSFGIKGRSTEDKELHPNPVDNYFKSQIDGLVGDICDRPADIQIAPQEESDEPIARKMDAAVKYCWYRNNGDRKIEYAVRRAVKHGPLVGKVWWDNEWRGSANNPFVGDVRFIAVSPLNVFLDPRIKATEDGVHQQGAFMIYCVRRSLAYIRKHYPENGYKVSADSYASYVTTNGVDETNVYLEDQEALLVEFWYRGEPLADDFPEPDEPRIPREGWVHKAVVAGNVLLEHISWVYPWYPFALDWFYPTDDSIYCTGDGYDMLMPQLVLNKLNEISVEGAVLQSQGNWLTEIGNIRNNNHFQKYASMGGSALPVTEIGRTQRVLGGNVPGSLFTHYRQELAALETVTGRFDVAQGRTPRRVQAASAIALLLQQSGGRVRQRARAVSSFIQQIVLMMVDLIGMYYTEERLVRVLGENGQRVMGEVSRKDFVKTKVLVDPITGERAEEEYVPEFDITVTAGTETPTSRAYYSELATQLFTMGVIDDVALLDTLQFPRWREIMARKQAAAAPLVPGVLEGGPAPPAPESAAMMGASQVAQDPLMRLGGANSGDLGQLAAIINALQGGA